MIQFVNQLVAFFENTRVYYSLDIFSQHFYSVLEPVDLLVFHVQRLLILNALLFSKVWPRLQFSFRVSDHLPAELSQAIVKVLNGKYHAWAWGHSFYYCATVFESCQQDLDCWNFDRHVKVEVVVNPVEDGRCELLERVYVVLNVRHLDCETPG